MFWWRHDIWISGKLKTDYLKNIKNFWIETKNPFFLISKVLSLRHTRQNSKNIAKILTNVLNLDKKDCEVIIKSTSFVKIFWKFREHLLFGCFGVCIYYIDNVTSVIIYLNSQLSGLHVYFVADMSYIVSRQVSNIYVKKTHRFEISLWSLRLKQN